jgi:hypothetical protein
MHWIFYVWITLGFASLLNLQFELVPTSIIAVSGFVLLFATAALKKSIVEPIEE